MSLRYHTLILVFSLCVNPARGQDVDRAARDRFGTPLPNGALVRLGIDLERRTHLGQVAFSRDGKMVVTEELPAVGGGPLDTSLIRVSEVDSGRERGQWCSVQRLL